MDPQTFPDHSAVLFGREPDLTLLAARAEHNGVTVVLGRPKMGKSWALTELARRLSAVPVSIPSPATPLSLSQPSAYLIGFSDPEGSAADQLLRAVVDLYTRWLAQSSYRDQALIWYQQHQSDLIGIVGHAVGTILKDLSALGGKPLEAVGGLAKDVLDGLASANHDLLSGGMQMLPRLQTDQARDLLDYLFKISSRRIVLILDQWEKSTNLDIEINILDAFLRHLDVWPPCHIFLGVRSSPETDAKLWRQRGGFSKKRQIVTDPMYIHQLPPMDLAGSEGTSLLDHIRDKVPFASEVSNQILLRMIAGYPGTVDAWTKTRNASLFDSIQKLREYADAANEYRYQEFDTILPQLDDVERRLAMRLALVPLAGDPSFWSPLTSIVLDGCDETLLDNLRERGILERALPPTFEHPTKFEAACRWFAEHCEVEFSRICERLVLTLAGEIRGLTWQALPHSLALFGVSVPGVKISRAATALLVANASLFAPRQTDSAKLIGAAAQLAAKEEAAPLLAMGLFIALNRANRGNNLKRRDALLEDLRTLASNHPENAAVRENLAKSLFNALFSAAENGDVTSTAALLRDLHTLSDNYPEDDVVRGILAMGLVNTLNQAKRDNDLERRDALLEDLCALALDRTGDETVRKALANGLCNTLIAAEEENNLKRCHALLNDLRGLSNNFPEDSAVRKELATSLFNSLLAAKTEKDLTRRDTLVAELRALATSYPEDAAVRADLLRALSNTLLDAIEENDPKHCDALIEELRVLATEHLEDSMAREAFATALYNTNRYVLQAGGGLALQDASLESLRALATSHASDAVVRDRLAKSLNNTIVYAKLEGNLTRMDALMKELFSLAAAFPGDADICQLTDRLKQLNLL
jgi:hypothetical protein